MMVLPKMSDRSRSSRQHNNPLNLQASSSPVARPGASELPLRVSKGAMLKMTFSARMRWRPSQSPRGPVSAALVYISNLPLGRRGIAISGLSVHVQAPYTYHRSQPHPFKRSGTQPWALPVVAAWTRLNARWHTQTTAGFPQDPSQDVIVGPKSTSWNPLSISHRTHTQALPH